jgi:4-hydroxy-tetrahydrodipicolinate synthase
MSSPWCGLFPALWTPTDAAGQVLWSDLEDQVRFLKGAGVDGLMVLGTTGEFAYLDLPTRQEVLRRVIAVEPGWRIIANCSDVSPLRVAVLGRHAREVGASAMALLPPWYHAVSPEDAAEFMVQGAKSAGLPLALYNFPERTGHRLAAETIASVCDRVQVVALKQSGADFEYHRELAHLAEKKGFVLVTGSDTRIPEAFDLGARGAVSGLANAVPEWVVGAFRAMQQGRRADAEKEARRLQSLATCLQGLESSLDVMAAMTARGRPTGVFKPAVSSATQARFERAVERARPLLTF